jgi:hypothetical protein
MVAIWPPVNLPDRLSSLSPTDPRGADFRPGRRADHAGVRRGACSWSASGGEERSLCIKHPSADEIDRTEHDRVRSRPSLRSTMEFLDVSEACLRAIFEIDRVSLRLRRSRQIVRACNRDDGPARCARCRHEIGMDPAGRNGMPEMIGFSLVCAAKPSISNAGTIEARDTRN